VAASRRAPATTARCAGRCSPCPGRVDAAVDAFQLDAAVERVLDAVDAANRHLTASAPWAAGADPARARGDVRASLDAIAAIAGELSPFLPSAAAAVAGAVGADLDAAPWQQLADGAALPPPRPLFPARAA
jgi:methionyl-tRNA synthetase